MREAEGSDADAYIAKALGLHRQPEIPGLWLLGEGPGFHFSPSPTAQLWSASEMIKTKRILNAWNSLFTTDAICLFSLPLSPPFL